MPLRYAYDIYLGDEIVAKGSMFFSRRGANYEAMELVASTLAKEYGVMCSEFTIKTRKVL